MSPRARRAAMAGVLRSSLVGRGRQLRSLMAWSLVEALPAFASGALVARAIDDGFLDGETTTGRPISAPSSCACLPAAGRRV